MTPKFSNQIDAAGRSDQSAAVPRRSDNVILIIGAYLGQPQLLVLALERVCRCNRLLSCNHR